jgi:hypothetical protein
MARLDGFRGTKDEYIAYLENRVRDCVHLHSRPGPGSLNIPRVELPRIEPPRIEPGDAFIQCDPQAAISQIKAQNTPLKCRVALKEWALTIKHCDWKARREALRLLTEKDIGNSIEVLLSRVDLKATWTQHELQPEGSENLFSLPMHLKVGSAKRQHLIQELVAFVRRAEDLQLLKSHTTNLGSFQEILVTTVCVALLGGKLTDNSMDWLMGIYVKGASYKHLERLRRCCWWVHRVIVELNQRGWGHLSTEMFLLC